jgi:single-strand DNA-binding protein
MHVSINQVAITGCLTREPALITLPSGHVLCEIQIASNHKSHNDVTGIWEEWPDYFTVKAFGHQARTAHEHLCKGQGVAIQGRLSSRLVVGADGAAQYVVEIMAGVVQFLSRPRGR